VDNPCTARAALGTGGLRGVEALWAAIGRPHRGPARPRAGPRGIHRPDGPL